MRAKHRRTLRAKRNFRRARLWLAFNLQLGSFCLHVSHSHVCKRLLVRLILPDPLQGTDFDIEKTIQRLCPELAFARGYMSLKFYRSEFQTLIKLHTKSSIS